MRFLTVTGAVALLVWASASTVPSLAQTNPGDSAFQNQFPDPLSYKPPVTEPPELQIVSVEQIEIAGPLLSGPRLVDGAVEVLTQAGRVRTAWSADASPALLPATPPDGGADVGEWALSRDGSHRAKAFANHVLMVQKTCPSCDSGWRKRWRLRVAGLAQVPPLVTEQRVYYGSADNQVYSVRRKNGHQAWVAPLDGRVLRPLALWVDGASPVAALLVVPEPGKELVVLDAVGGRPAFRYRLQDDEEVFIGPAVATPDGRIVLARQGYNPAEAWLVVLEIAQPAPKTPEPGKNEATGYNLPTSDEPIPARPHPGPPAFSKDPGS